MSTHNLLICCIEIFKIDLCFEFLKTIKSVFINEIKEYFIIKISFKTFTPIFILIIFQIQEILPSFEMLLEKFCFFWKQSFSDKFKNIYVFIESVGFFVPKN